MIGGIYRVETADVSFVFDVDGNEELVPVHRCILALHSPVFRRMLHESDLKEKFDIKLTDTTIDALVDFMQSLYARVFIDGTKSRISPLLYLAHKYDVNWLELRCKEILDGIIYNNAMDIFWVLPLINLYGYDETALMQTIRKHGNFLIKSDEFIDCEDEVLNAILDADFEKRDEVMVFKRCIA